VTKQKEHPLEDFSQEVDDLIDATAEDPDPARAVKRMQEAISSGLPQAQAARAYQVLGTRYEDLGSSEKAIECYTKSIEMYPNNPIVLFWRGELLFRQGRYDDAKVDFERALSLPPLAGLFSPELEQAREYLAQINRSSTS
jgi:tetratricopeptide (TPR) repeat protein